uniref:Putative anaerobic ribonucleoside-triphosphate reductase n=1 Tax=viral metagenome TaxID=1070528 RepID=A0A6H1ZFW8_9ZZZZ
MEDSATVKFIKGLFRESGRGCIELHGACQSCKDPVDIIIFKNAMEVEGNGGVIVGDMWDDKPQFKCSRCLERDSGMISPTKCEIFTRVVGYLRPIQGFNLGKAEEFRDRKTFKIKEEI